MSIEIKNVNYLYSQGTSYEMHALKNVNLEIPTSGHIYYNGEDIDDEKFSMKKLRSKVGLVFQYPEHQLFETEVLADVCFGPKNLGFTKEEAEEKAKAALRMVGMGEEYDKSSPFELSGGQKRRVAIAGVLAMDPEVLILDEPTAGLDPRGRDEVLDQVSALQRSRGITVILVSHSMEDVAKYVDRLIVMNQGEVRFDGRPVEVFHHYKELEEIGLAAPQTTYLMQELKKQGADVNTDATTVEEAADAIEAWLKASK